MRIGIFGGTFNPPHLGHLIIADQVSDSLALDKILFVPAAIPPHKIGAPFIAPDVHRVAMLRLATSGNQRFDVSSVELERGGISYTVDTVEAIASSYPDAELHVLIGADNFVEFHTWRNPERISALARLVVLHRSGFDPAVVDPRWGAHVVPVQTPIVEISSTEIRERVRAKRSIRYRVPSGVEEYIMKHGLYR